MGSEEKYFSGNISGASVTGNMTAAYFSGRLNIPSGKGGGNYEELSNKPRINGVELLGDRSFSELGFPDIPDMTGYAKLSDIPSRLPADGGDADTVGGHTVKADVPENAVFTDTVPDLSGYAKITDIPSSLPANGGNADTVGGIGIADLRQITQTVINTLPAVPNGEGDFFVICDLSDTSFPYWYGHLSVRYGSYTGEYVATFRTTGNDNKVYYNTYLTNHWYGWQEISATPIKSTQISGTTSTTGNVQLWAADDKRIPLAAVITDRYAYIFRSSNGFYYIGICHPDHHTMSGGEAVSGTVYYIEQG